MNPLMHTTFTLQLLKEAGMPTNQPEIILGSILPDISILGVIPEIEAHKKGMEFLDYLSHNEPSLKPFGIGWILHGENPQCLDYYVHKPNGYIDQKKHAVLELSKKHNITFEGIHQDVLAHTLIEFACDSLAEKDIPKQLHKAFKQANLEKIAFHTATFFKGNPKKILRILTIFKYFNFNKLRTPHGIAHSFQDFMTYYKFANKKTISKGWITACKLIWARVNEFKTHKLINLIKDVRAIVEKDCNKFLQQSKTKIYTNILHKSLAQYM